MLNHFWWGAIFLINLPVAALGLVAVVTLVPESKDRQGDRPDLLGAVLSTIGMAALRVRDHLRARARLDVRPGCWPGRPSRSGCSACSRTGRAGSRIRCSTCTSSGTGGSRARSPGAVLIAFGMGGVAVPAHPAPPVRARLRPAGGGAADRAARADAWSLLNFTGVAAKLAGSRLGTPVAIALGMTLMSAGLACDRACSAGHGYAGTLLGLVLIGVGCALAIRPWHTRS